MDGPPPALAVRELEVVYGDSLIVLRGVNLDVVHGSIVALLGANGAGKTTLLRAVSGLLRVHHGAVTGGSVELDGEPVDRLDAPARVRRGMAQVMEGRRIFAELTVDENLRAGSFTRRDRSEVRENHDRVLTMFPVLAKRRASTAGYLSGGEQQMLAIGRALMANPRLVLLDEPSLGLAPMIVQQIRDIIVTINESGTSVLLVEQNARMALSIAHQGFVLASGRIVKSGPGPQLLADADIQQYYLGMGPGGRRSYRDLKRRVKRRWIA
ncbi:MAG: ABC transporter ATP-binding protein [Acidimicrobiia bacterium]